MTFHAESANFVTLFDERFGNDDRVSPPTGEQADAR